MKKKTERQVCQEVRKSIKQTWVNDWIYRIPDQIGANSAPRPFDMIWRPSNRPHMIGLELKKLNGSTLKRDEIRSQQDENLRHLEAIGDIGFIVVWINHVPKTQRKILEPYITQFGPFREERINIMVAIRATEMNCQKMSITEMFSFKRIIEREKVNEFQMKGFKKPISWNLNCIRMEPQK